MQLDCILFVGCYGVFFSHSYRSTVFPPCVFIIFVANRNCKGKLAVSMLTLLFTLSSPADFQRMRWPQFFPHPITFPNAGPQNWLLYDVAFASSFYNTLSTITHPQVLHHQVVVLPSKHIYLHFLVRQSTSA